MAIASPCAVGKRRLVPHQAGLDPDPFSTYCQPRQGPKAREDDSLINGAKY